MKYVNPEPTMTAITDDEEYGDAYEITNLTYLAASMIKGTMLTSNGVALEGLDGYIGQNLTSKDPGNLPVWEYPP